MIRASRIVALGTMLALAGLGAAVASPPQPARASDRQVKELLTRTEKDADRFRKSLDKALDRSRLDGSRDEDDIDRFVADFARATARLSERFDRQQVVGADVDDVLRRGVTIDRFMQRQPLATAAENDWRTVRRDLDQLAQAYNVAWDWNSPTYASDDRQVGDDRQLTGTYRLDRGRSDDARRAAEQAARALPANQRQAVSQRLMERLRAPETLAIDRSARTVTLASSSGKPVTFEADGTIHAERGYPGGTANTRATLFGDQLVVATTGTGSSDYQVTFEPLDDGRELQVTRRILDDAIRQPVTVQSVYRRTSAEARWDVYPADRTGGAPYGSSDLDAMVPDGTRVVATLDTALSTRTARPEDRFTLIARSPSSYEGAVIAGTVTNATGSDRLSGRAEMTLSFESIRMRDGRSYPFAGTLEAIRTPDGETLRVESGTVGDASQTEKTVERGAIGAAIGAIVGAISGGGKGAAIGAVLGAGGGAGTVIVQGRDELDLARGTELTIVSIRAGRPTSR